jgi:hypothetical protein
MITKRIITNKIISNCIGVKSIRALEYESCFFYSKGKAIMKHKEDADMAVMACLPLVL